jgi:hypothetical protein
MILVVEKHIIRKSILLGEFKWIVVKYVDPR